MRIALGLLLTILSGCAEDLVPVAGPESTGASLLVLDRGVVTAVDARHASRLRLPLGEPAREVVVAEYAQTMEELGLAAGPVADAPAGRPLPPPRGVWSARFGEVVSPWVEVTLPDALRRLRTDQPSICRDYLAGARSEVAGKVPVAGILWLQGAAAVLTATRGAQRLEYRAGAPLALAPLDLPADVVPRVVHVDGQGDNWVGGQRGSHAYLARLSAGGPRTLSLDEADAGPLVALASSPTGVLFALDSRGALWRAAAGTSRLEQVLAASGTVAVQRSLAVLAEDDVLVVRDRRREHIERWSAAQGHTLEPVAVEGVDLEEEWVHAVVVTSRGEAFAATRLDRYLRREADARWIILADRQDQTERLQAIAPLGDGSFSGGGVVGVVDLYDPGKGRMCAPFVSVLGAQLSVQELRAEGPRIWVYGSRYADTETVVSRYLLPAEP